MKECIFILIAFFTGNIFSQKQITYYENGEIKIISSIEDDIEKITHYYETGQLKRKLFKNNLGKKVNTDTRYFKSGKLAYIWNYNDEGKKDGKWIDHNEEGSYSTIEYYTNGIKTGIWKVYMSGYLSSRSEYNKKGVLIKDISFRENGMKLNMYSYDSLGDIISKQYYDKKGREISTQTITIIGSSCN